VKFEIVDGRTIRTQSMREKLKERAAVIAEKYKTQTLQQIASEEGVSRERIRQILKSIGINKTAGWRYRLSASKSAVQDAAAVKRREERCQKLYGCDWNTYCQISGDTRLYGKQSGRSGRGLIGAFWQHYQNARRIDVPWTITLPQYAEIVGDNLSEIGRGKLNLGRKDKNGPFSRENCELVQHSENSRRTRYQAAQENTPEILRTIARMDAAGIGVAEISRAVGRAPSTVRIYLYRLTNRKMVA